MTALFTLLPESVGTIDADSKATILDQLAQRFAGVYGLDPVLVLERLPKTRSGKILRKTMRQIVDGEDFVVPPTIEDISVLEDLTVALVGNPEPMKPA